jgi:aspartate carbamoyltransferase catalytic subunit
MKSTLAGRDINSIKELNKKEILDIIKIAKKLKISPKNNLLKGKILASCFFEPSTRTRLSTEAAMLRLGGSVIGFADPGVTSFKKGETLHDSIKIIGQYVDIIAIRHFLEGAAQVASDATDKPVINCGDGSNQHPTQTLIDLFSILECQKKIDGLHIAMMGDPKHSRTMHSLAEALMHFKVQLYFVAPPSLQMPNSITDELKRARIKFSFHENMDDVLKKVDILYTNRVQEERFADRAEFERLKDVYVLRADKLQGVKKNMHVLNPLPRINEISTDVDATPHAYYFQQAANGLYVRQALLALLLGKI